MNIALLAPLWKTVPPEKYGGSELVVANLALGLSRLGHSVYTFACAGSEVAGTLVPVLDRPMHELAGGFDWRGVQPYEFLSFFEFAKRIKDFDIAHNHMGIHPVALAPLLPIPLVTTLHSSAPPDFPSLARAFCDYPFVSVSNAQRKLAPMLRYIATIYHGIDASAFTPRFEGAGKGFVFIGTMSRNKGADVAVRMARALGMPLVLAGDIREGDREFFDREVAPFLDGKERRFIGEIGHREKNKLLSEADALLFPSRWNEAFGLVMVEALMCGTPVIALNNGAVPEIIENGKTGFVADTEGEMESAAKRFREIDRRACRAHVEEKFTLERMAAAYEKVYEQLI